MRSLVVSSLLLLSGCGPGYILLEVQSDLEIPAQTDELHVVAFAAADERSLVNSVAQLDPSDQFPLDLAFEPSGDTPETVLVFRVRALLESIGEVAAGEVRSDWDGGDLSIAVVLEPTP